MKLQIDTQKKTIKVEGEVKFKELTKALKSMLPDWEDYTLETNTVVQWHGYPVYREPYIPYRQGWLGDTTVLTGTSVDCTFTGSLNKTDTHIINMELN